MSRLDDVRLGTARDAIAERTFNSPRWVVSDVNTLFPASMSSSIMLLLLAMLSLSLMAQSMTTEFAFCAVTHVARVSATSLVPGMQLPPYP